MTPEQLKRMTEIQDKINTIDWTFHMPSDVKTHYSPIHRLYRRVFELRKEGLKTVVGYHYGVLKHSMELEAEDMEFIYQYFMDKRARLQAEFDEFGKESSSE